MNTVLRPPAQVIVALIVLVCLASTLSAQEESPKTVVVGTIVSSPWSAFVNFCDTIAPYCGVITFLAPLPTIKQISRDKSVGDLPLLPYSSMISNCFVWICYGLMKRLPNVWAPNAIGALLGAYYFTTFVRHCGPMASHLPGTVENHVKTSCAIILFNLCLAASGIKTAWKVIGKEGVLFCIILFASPLAALKHVIATKSAASIPLPFTLACLVNCTAWFVMGWWKLQDFNIYFPNLMGLCCAVAQLVLKGMYGNRVSEKGGLPP